MKKSVLFITISLIIVVLFISAIYVGCTSYNYKIRSHPLNVCVTFQVKVLKFFATLEEGSNKLDIIPTNHANFENTYTSKEYNYSISYPNSWVLEEYTIEDHETINLYNKSSEAVIEIGLPQGSVCANMGCDYNAGSIYTPFGDFILTKAFNSKRGFFGFTTGTKVEYYGFFNNMIPFTPNELPFIKSSFSDEQGGIEVANILDTIVIRK